MRQGTEVFDLTFVVEYDLDDTGDWSGWRIKSVEPQATHATGMGLDDEEMPAFHEGVVGSVMDTDVGTLARWIMQRVEEQRLGINR